MVAKGAYEELVRALSEKTIEKSLDWKKFSFPDDDLHFYLSDTKKGTKVACLKIKADALKKLNGSSEEYLILVGDETGAIRGVVDGLKGGVVNSTIGKLYSVIEKNGAQNKKNLATSEKHFIEGIRILGGCR